MDNPIGIFDSGIGGLTVVKQLMKHMPHENLVYFGDTARVPYGTKSKKLIQQYAVEDAAFLEQFDIKLLVVACNSASSTALNLLESDLTIPVTGVILPGVEGAITVSKNNRIGVIGTTATVNSGMYERLLTNLGKQIVAVAQACPLLVPLVEEGWIEDEITKLTIQKYLDPLLTQQIDTLILGCTHFPVLRRLIQEEAGEGIILIDSGEQTAAKVKNMLSDMQIERAQDREGSLSVYVSDIPGKFEEIGTRFLGSNIISAQRVDFDAFLMNTGDKIYRSLNLSDNIR